MISRERITNIIAGKPVDRVGLWIGHPLGETWEIYFRHFGTDSQQEIRARLGDDLVWIPAGEYRGEHGWDPFNIPGKDRHGFEGPFAECESIEDIDAADFVWPTADLLDFSGTLKQLQDVKDLYRASGMWTPFYHNIMDLFGMENYMVKMYTDPEVVEEVTRRVCTFYYEGNKKFLELAGEYVDGFFFGNDFGTQRDMICGPVQFDQFIMPWFKKFTDLAHSFDKQVILHSCGSIYRVIDRLIDNGVNCLHPLQAKAQNMNAEYLAEHYKDRISFMGGVDTQDLLVNGTPEEVAADVRRVKDLLGPRLIVSPSHEAVLPNVPPENIIAMAQATLEA